MHLPEGLVYLYAALRGRRLMACQWLAVGKMLRIPRLALLSFRWRTWRNPQDITSWWQQGHIHINVYGEFDRARAIYDRGLAASPESADLWKVKGDLLARCTNDRGALEAYDRALALTDEKVPLLIEKSRVYFHGQNRPDQALETADSALALAPDSITALAWKQCIFLQLGKRDEVEAINDRILEIDPKNAGALLRRARALRNTGKGHLALGVYDAVLFHTPDRVAIWEARARLLLELHRYPDALESVEKALSLDPEGREGPLSAAEELRGDSLFRLRRYGEALAAYDRVLAHDPGWHPAAVWEKKAGACFGLGDFPGTVSACDRALALAGQERLDTTELRSLRDAAQVKIPATRGQ